MKNMLNQNCEKVLRTVTTCASVNEYKACAKYCEKSVLNTVKNLC